MHQDHVIAKIIGKIPVLLLLSGVWSQSLQAEPLMTMTPRMEAQYESRHQGVLQVNATLFHAPCRLQFTGREIRLTECGAGQGYRAMKVFNATASSPVSLRFYHVEQGKWSTRTAILLGNGNNVVRYPALMAIEKAGRHKALQLEVSYE